MESGQGSHSVHSLQVHIVWITKYRYRMLQSEVQFRCREILRKAYNNLNIGILKCAVSKDHIHLHLSYPPKVEYK
jgi:putative transposase